MHLDKNKIKDIKDYLLHQQLMNADEIILSAEKPGEGNMNYVLRINLPYRSLIIKQARPYVEKYPSIAAPEERVIIEGEFYKQIASKETLSVAMPQMLKMDKANHIIILEDVGEANDFTFLYQPEAELSEEEAISLASFLTVLHSANKASDQKEFMANRKLRALNHEHIFIYPLMADNGFDLNTVQQGLQELSVKYKNNEALKTKAKELGEIYLKDGDTLLHGDYYPGSWLKTATGVKVIDPEFCFYGAPEFDLGIMLAHLLLAQQDEVVLKTVLASYDRPGDFNDQLFNEFTGIEIIRRIIGLAQLPMTLTLPEKEALLQKALGLLSLI